MPKFSAYMKGEGVKGDTGRDGGFGIISATAHISDIPSATVQVTGPNYKKNFNFDFGLVTGEAAGFSTEHTGSIEIISITSEPSLEVSVNPSPNIEKSFDFKFGIPEPLSINRIEQTVLSTTSEGENQVTIYYNDNSSTTFIVHNGEQGEAAFIDGVTTDASLLPNDGNHTGRAYLVGDEGNKNLYVYIDGEWKDQGSISGAGFGIPTYSVTTLPPGSNAEINVTIDPNSPEIAKIFNFDFKIPQGPKGDQGPQGDTPIISITTSVTTILDNSNPIVSVTTINDNNFQFDFGLPKGFIPEMDATVSTSNLQPGELANVSVTVNENVFHFDFGIPQGVIGQDGPPGPPGIGFYQTIPFTSTEIDKWHQNNDGTYTLIIDRTSNEIIPINIYNANNNNIAATFILAASTQDYEYGSIQYRTEEKFDGVLYYIGKAPTPELRAGSVTTAEYPAVTTRRDGYDTIVDFTLPTKGVKGDTGNGIESITTLSVNGLTTTYRINYTNNDYFDYNVVNGEKGDAGTSIKSITTLSVNGFTTTYRINFDNNEYFDYNIVNGKKGDKGDQGDQGIQGIQGEQGIPGPGITNITGPVQDPNNPLRKIYTIHYGINDSTTTFVITDGANGTSQFSQLFGSPYDNTSLSTVLDNKVNKGEIVPIEYGSNVTSISTNSNAGLVNSAARSDHVHSISLATGDNNGEVKIAGSNVSVKGLGSLAYKSSISSSDISLATGDNNGQVKIANTNVSVKGLGSLAYKSSISSSDISLATGDNNGQVKIANTNVSVKGLGSLAYKSALDGSDITSGVVGATHGGTGQTSLKNSANELINALGTGNSNAQMEDYIVTQYAGGGTSVTTYHRRPLSKLLAKSNIITGLGFTPVNKIGDTITGTLILSKIKDAQANEAEAKTETDWPALIVGGTYTQSHLEFDNNEIVAKTGATTAAELSLNYNGGIVNIGPGGIKIGNGTNITKVSLVSASSNTITSGSTLTTGNILIVYED